MKSASMVPNYQSFTEEEERGRQSPTGKRSVYEPKGPTQRCKQFVCSKNRAVLVIIGIALFILVVALIAALARPGPGFPPSCDITPSPEVESKQNHLGLATNGEKFPWTDIRLPEHIRPISYDLYMHPNLTTFTFTGHIEITIECVQATDFIVFHMKHLKYGTISLSDNGKQIKIIKSLEYVTNEQIYIKTDKALEKGKKYLLKVKFNGEISDLLVGFYRSSYTTKAGEKRWLATTHFEPTDARAAFPCFDEPQLKANFSMKMVREARHMALFNTERIATNELSETELLVDSFASSVSMSTYLVAFVVCDYDNITTTTSTGIKVSVFTPHEQITQANFALEAAKNMLEYYEQFFGLKYPLKKQDLIAIPDFAAGAMENWGLITYRMVALLYDPEESSTSSQQWVAVVVAHELAHQWFGNLVTMQWWNDLWLNEGFASYVEYIGTNHFKPDWKMLDQFISDALTAALYSDSLSSSHPISVDVNDPAEINEIFDQISYEKGSSIIRMMEGFLGKSQLEAGLKDYLDKHKYSNAATKDLWSAMDRHAGAAGLRSGVRVQDVMDTWTQQMGYPVVTVTMDGNKITATQGRFLLNPRGTQREEFTSPYDYTWHIPLTCITSQSPTAQQPMHWMYRNSVNFMLTEKPQWVKMNVNYTGFYRVHYDSDNWKALIKQLTEDLEVFLPADRANLLDDAFSLASSGHLNITTAMDLSSYLSREQDYVPWSVGLANLKRIGALLEAKPSYDFFSDYLKSLMASLLNTLEWKDEGSHLEKYLRGTILGTAVQLGDEASVTKAKEMYAQWMTGTKIAPNLKSVVYLGGIKYGGQEEWDYAWNQYQNTDIPSEKRQLLYALSTTTDSIRLNKFLHLSLDESSIRKGDTVMVIGNVASNSAGSVLAWRFVKQNWQELNKRYGDGSFDMTRLVLTTRKFSTQYDYDEVKQFFSTHDSGSGRRAVSQALESIEMNIDWLNRNEQSVVQWLREYSQNS